MIGALEEYLRGLGEVTVAYSGGVDSTFLVAMSARILGAGKVLAVTMQSPLTPRWEVAFAKELCHSRGIRHLLLDGSFVLDEERIVANPPERCYYCKRKILEAVRREIPADRPLLTGTNASDVADFRPGIKAEEEMGVRTPLRELGFTKDAIREYSKAYAIPGFERPSSPCFATRIPYGEPITMEKVRLIGEAETFLRGLGFSLVRVRLISTDTACIEVDVDEVKRLLDLREAILRQLLAIGFKRVTLDLEGYRQGKLNAGVAG
ncbi:MAG: ATP-dependent sacrificial sulfur transferase LarE [Desulfobacterales bacterium]|nr:ATP-dependent sacrificial sulfur transferase LarE [Desulfobacterales bacterium]